MNKHLTLPPDPSEHNRDLPQKPSDDDFGYSVLLEAYHILASAGQPLSPEAMWIENLYINTGCLSLFRDKKAYLTFVRTVTEERFNVSLPDQAGLYMDMASDCSALYDLTDPSSYNIDVWISDIRKLFETLKTPYYDLYAGILKRFRRHFTGQDLCSRCLKDYYSVIIKSTPKKLALIDRLADQIIIYTKYSFLSETLVHEILIHHLALFALEKSGWLDSLSLLLPSFCQNPDRTSSPRQVPDSGHPLSGEMLLLDKYLTTEGKFLESCSAGKPSGTDSKEDTGALFKDISGYLAALSRWMRKERQLKTGEGSSEPKSFPAHKEGRRHGSRGSFSKSPTGSSDFLDQYAYNMNQRKYITNPAIGREQELADLELILISPKKSPILIGEAGVGKTSVVEGLAYLMQKGDIPDLLGDKVIYKLTTTSLLSGTKYVGEMEERMKILTDELMQHPEILLFIDEIHTIVGAGSTVSSHNDISNMLKPFIDRGDIKIIGATTREEYEHFLLPDRALARRFYPIQVEEPDRDMTMEILLGTIPSIEHDTRVRSLLPEEEMTRLLEGLIDISAVENQPDGQLTRLPELPLSILEMAYSYAALHRRAFLEKEDFVRAVRHSSRLKKEVRNSYQA